MRSALLAQIQGHSCLQLVRNCRGKVPFRPVRAFMNVQEASTPPTREHSIGISAAPPVDNEQLAQAAVRVLTTPNAADKASLTHQTASMWRESRLHCRMNTESMPLAPARPARDATVSLEA